MDEKNRIVRNTLMLYMRMFFNIFIALITSRLILDVLGVVDYGIYNVVGGVVVLFTFLNSAMASSTQRYLTFEIGIGDQERLRSIFSTSIFIHIIISLFVLILAETIGVWLFYSKLTIPSERLNAAMWVYQLSICSCLVSIMSVPYNAAIIAREKMDVFAYISILDISLRLIVVVFLYFSPMDKLITYAFLLLVISVLIRVIYVIYCKRHIEEARFFLGWDRKLFFEMLYFAGWNLFGNLAYIGYTQGVNVLLNIFFGPAVNAARAIAIQLQGTVNNFCNSFQTALNPQITKSYAAGDKSYMFNLVYGSSKYSFFLLLLLALPLLIETEQILSLWLNIVPDYTVVFLRIMLLITIVDVMANPLIISAQATGCIRNYQLIIGGILLLIVPISYFVLKLGGSPVCAFFVHLSIVILAQVIRLWMIRGMIGLSLKCYFQQVIIPLVKVSSLSVIIPLLVFYFMEVSLLRLLIVIFVSCVSVLLIGYFIGLRKEEKTFVQDKIHVLIKKFL
jgi:O-antigen/teichoic acid export membrane protein